MKRPLAYITAAWCGDPDTDMEIAARYCRMAYEAGFSPICPILYLPLFINDAIPEEHKNGIDMRRDMLRRSHVLVVCGGEVDEDVKNDIAAVKKAVGDKILKVIIETCLLTDAEKEKMCDIVPEAGADYIKTSTGFSTGGATFADIELFARCVKGRCKIKAAGGISSIEDMEKFVALGADRLGTSRAIGLMQKAGLV